MIKMRNVGAQTQKKWRPGGPPLEGRGGRRVEPGGMGPEGSGAQTQKKLGPQGLGSEGWGPEGSGTAAWGLEGWGPEGGGPKISRFFFPLPPPFSFFFSLWGSSRGNLVFEALGPLNVHVGSSRAVVWTPGGAEGRRGFTRQPENSKGPGLQKHHQNSTRRPLGQRTCSSEYFVVRFLWDQTSSDRPRGSTNRLMCRSAFRTTVLPFMVRGVTKA